MATIPHPAAAWGLRPKYLLFTVLGLMVAYVLYHNERFLIDAADPNWPRYRLVAPWLLPHGILGAIALSLGFTQFSTRLRAAWPRLHRICGRVYVGTVCLVAPLGAYIQYYEERMGGTHSYTLATITFAFAWLLATLMAFWCIRQRRFEQHRQWMTRSFAMALVFLEVRVIGGLTGLDEVPATDEMVVWTCVAFGYPLADAVLQIEDWLRTPRGAQRATRPVAP